LNPLAPALWGSERRLLTTGCSPVSNGLGGGRREGMAWRWVNEDEACWEVGGGRYWAVDSPSPITPCRASKTQNTPWYLSNR